MLHYHLMSAEYCCRTHLCLLLSAAYSSVSPHDEHWLISAVCFPSADYCWQNEACLLPVYFYSSVCHLQMNLWLISALCYCDLLTTANRMALFYSCLLSAVYCYSSLCPLMLNLGWYPLSVSPLLTTANRMKHVCYLLYTATLLCVTSWWMLADICCLLLPPAACRSDACSGLSAAAYSCSSARHLTLNADWYLLSAIATCFLLTTDDCFPGYRLISIAATGWYQLPVNASPPFPSADCCWQTYYF